jgi:hypothetical protein
MRRIRAVCGGVILCAAGIAGCTTTVPRDALMLAPQSIERRQMQTRQYPTSDEAKILQASAGLLQDVGFTLDSSRSSLGLICASKDRGAVEGGQVAGAVVMAALFGVSTPIDQKQKIRVSIVTFPTGSQIAVRVTFQRIVWNSYGQVSRLELLDDAKMYEEFFDKLSKAVFLEGQRI